MFPSLDTVASEAISFEQMIVISTATMAQIHLMQAFQGLCHPLDVINRGKISFFHSRKREERKREMAICSETHRSHNPRRKLCFSNIMHKVFTRKGKRQVGHMFRIVYFPIYPSSFVRARLPICSFYCKCTLLFTV